MFRRCYSLDDELQLPYGKRIITQSEFQCSIIKYYKSREAAPNLLTSPFRKKHPLANKLSLVAAVLASELSTAKDILKN